MALEWWPYDLALLEYDCYEDHHKILFMKPCDDATPSWWPIDKSFLCWEEVKYRYETWRAKQGYKLLIGGRC